MNSQNQPSVSPSGSHPIATIRMDFAKALLQGLFAQQKNIPCRFLYDVRGSQLFEEITKLPEYYLTRTETRILQSAFLDLSNDVDRASALVEFGSGSSAKTEMLLKGLSSRLEIYCAIDISQDALSEAILRIAKRFPQITSIGLALDFLQTIELPTCVQIRPKLGFLPGSTIGNFESKECINLLSHLRKTLGPDAKLLIGTDLEKSVDVMLSAYQDSAGVTAQFIKNILVHANHAVGTNFVSDQFQYHSLWNSKYHRIELYLVSLCRQSISLLGRSIVIEEGERLHIENSHKYSIDGFRMLASLAGWKPKRVWTDDQSFFAVHLMST